MPGGLAPDFSPALARMRELASADRENLLETLDEFAQTGLPLFVFEIDEAATGATGDLAFSYKVSDEFEARLAAAPARDLDQESGGV